MEELHWMNPLSVEAELFLNALKSHSEKKYNFVDEELCNKLGNIVNEIQKLLSKPTKSIVETNRIKILSNDNLKSVQRIFYCSDCKLDLGKAVEKVTIHLIDFHKPNADQTTVRPTASNKPQIFKLSKKVKGLLKKDLSKFFYHAVLEGKALKNSPDYDKVNQQLVETIKTNFQSEDIKLYMFGSRISGIGNANSDLDIFIDIGNSFNVFENTASVETLQKLEKVTEALKKNSDEWCILRQIPQARVPIIRVNNLLTGLQCDLGFSNSMGYCNTQLMSYYFELQPMAKFMCIFLKKWMDESLLDIPTYIICLMVIYFLQLNGYLPSVKSLQENADTPTYVGPWNVQFAQKTLKELNMESVNHNSVYCKKLLKLFFKLYAEFNYDYYAICPYLGTRTQKSQIEFVMPDNYTNYVKDTGNTNGIETSDILVQDPLQLNHNIAKNISEFKLNKLKQLFSLSAELIERAE